MGTANASLSVLAGYSALTLNRTEKRKSHALLIPRYYRPPPKVNNVKIHKRLCLKR